VPSTSISSLTNGHIHQNFSQLDSFTWSQILTKQQKVKLQATFFQMPLFKCPSIKLYVCVWERQTEKKCLSLNFFHTDRKQNKMSSVDSQQEINYSIISSSGRLNIFSLFSNNNPLKLSRSWAKKKGSEMV